jgi:hypothetical protein
MISASHGNLAQLEIPKKGLIDSVNRAVFRRYNVTAHAHLIDSVNEIDIVLKLINGCIEQQNLQIHSGSNTLIDQEEARNSIHESFLKMRENISISALCLFRKIENELVQRLTDRSTNSDELLKKRQQELIDTIDLIHPSNTDITKLHDSVLNLTKWFQKFSQKGYEKLSLMTPLSLTSYRKEFLPSFNPSLALNQIFQSITHNSSSSHNGLAGIAETIELLKDNQSTENFEKLSKLFQELRDDISAVRI